VGGAGAPANSIFPYYNSLTVTITPLPEPGLILQLASGSLGLAAIHTVASRTAKAPRV
jgi:hypothetical protein